MRTDGNGYRAFVLLAALVGLALTGRAARAEEIGCVTTEWKLVGANHKVCVYGFTDPDLPNVVCYLSQARTGGIAGSIGMAEDLSEFSLDCKAVGPVSLPEKFPDKKKVFSEGTSVLFKNTEITRMLDAKRNTLIYLAVSRKIISGSPKNSVSAVPVR
jgi:CreA protein